MGRGRTDTGVHASHQVARFEANLPAGMTLERLLYRLRRTLPTVRDVYLALAGLGGHLGRTGDGPPGWHTLWLGRRSLRLLVKGVNMAAQLLDD